MNEPISMDGGKNKIHFVDKKISKNKHLEIQWGRFDESNTSLFAFEFRWDRKQSHAGLEWHNEILRWHFRIAVYDIRHWDYDKGEWEE